ncbi:phospholipase, partial [Pseudomonas syringae pv. actinidiae]|nr:phospholipase [Pseudomonas syringae pv. actinidiae]
YPDTGGRRRLWDLHTKGFGVQDEPSDAFKAWGEIIKRNKDFQNSKLKPEAPLVEFYYAQTSMTDFD